MSARLSFSSFSPKYCKAVAENAINPLFVMCHEARSIFLGSKNVLNLVYFCVFQKYTVSDPLDLPQVYSVSPSNRSLFGCFVGSAIPTFRQGRRRKREKGSSSLFHTEW